MEGGYLNPSIGTPRLNNLRKKFVKNSSLKKVSRPPIVSFSNHLDYKNTNGFSTFIEPSQCLPLLPHGGTKIAFGNSETHSSKAIEENVLHDHYPPVQFLGRYNDTQSNQYEVPFNHYSSANNLGINAAHKSFFRPTSRAAPRSNQIQGPYKDVIGGQTDCDSLPSLLDSSGYIQSKSNQNENMLSYILQPVQMNGRVQPQGSSSTSSNTSNLGTKLHVYGTANHLANL